MVSLATPSQPVLQTTITIKDTIGASNRGNAKFDNVSVSAGAVDVISHPSGKNVLAIATQRCEQSFFAGARVEFWDVTNPAGPVQISTYDPTWGIVEDVRMFTRGGNVYALVTTPFSIGNAHDATTTGDLRVVDITNIAAPTQIANFPEVSIGQDSVNGCKTFQAGRAVAPTPDRTRAILSWYDGSPLFGARTGALFNIDLQNVPKHVTGTDPPKLTPDPPKWGYPADKGVEGNLADVLPFTGPAGQLLVLGSEDDIDPSVTRLTITSPAVAGGTFEACESPLEVRLSQMPGQQVSGGVAYLGRGCPAHSLHPVADEYLADPSGKIALLDSGGSAFQGCSAADKAIRAIGAGATAVMINGGSDVILHPNNGAGGGMPSRPLMAIQSSGYNKMQYVPSPVLTSATFPTTWARSSTTNVTAELFPAGDRTDRRRFQSLANATDAVARGEVATASRFPVSPGQSYEAGAFLQVQSRSAGSFRAAVVWYNAAGSPLSESEIRSLSAFTPRTRYEQTVVAPPGAATGTVKFEWTGPAAQGTAFADSFEFVPAGLQASVKANKGEWGAQRIIDFSQNPPAEVGSYRSPGSQAWPPPHEGLFAPRLARQFGSDLAFTTWLSDGLRVLDLSNPASPREVGRFVPPDVADPAPSAGAGAGLSRGQVWPNRALVTGVDVIPTGPSTGTLVISDINAGLYVLGFRVNRVAAQTPVTTTTQPQASGNSAVPGTSRAASPVSAVASGSTGRSGSAGSTVSSARGRGTTRLSKTGSNALKPIALALAFIVVGGAAMAVGRRRRPSPARSRSRLGPEP